jgi:cathepsin A (carboxypeptidase C)
MRHCVLLQKRFVGMEWSVIMMESHIRVVGIGLTVRISSILRTFLLTPHDLVTIPCELEDICYAGAKGIQDYLNLPSSFEALGVPSAVQNFSVISRDISYAFAMTADAVRSLAPELQYLLSSQIDILVYQGNLDLACNTAGAKRWTANMAWKGQMEFTAKDLKPWMSVEGGEEVLGGTFKEVNVKMVKGSEKTTRFALVTVTKAGHMVRITQVRLGKIY